jgi:uncharacterized membrane protein
MIKGLITILACSVLMAVLAVPLILRKVPRNGIYGFRTHTTLRDDEMWYVTNAYFGRGLFIASLITIISMIVLYYTPDVSPVVFLKATIATLVAPQLVMMLFTMRFIRKLESRRINDEQKDRLLRIRASVEHSYRPVEPGKTSDEITDGKK